MILSSIFLIRYKIILKFHYQLSFLSCINYQFVSLIYKLQDFKFKNF
jgi:hypothetical protein